MQSQVQERFSAYYERWLVLQESNLNQLLSVPRDPSHEHEHRRLVSKVTHLYKEYYVAKWAGAREDILGFFSPSWLSPLENAHLWITGWKPSMFYRLVHSLRHSRVPVGMSSTITTNNNNSLVSLSDEKVKKIEEMRWKTSVEEERVESEMERQQVSMADRRIVELARLANGGRPDVEVSRYVDVALNNLLVGLERVMKSADCVRLKALKGLLEVLSPLQCVDFMAAVLIVQIRLRSWGKRDHPSS